MAFYQFPTHTTVVGTDFDTFLTSGGLHIPTNGANEVTLVIKRTAETGTCTLTAFPQWLDPTTNTFHDLLDENDATAMQSVAYADGAVDTTGYRLLVIKQILPVGHTTGKKVYGTNHAAYQAPWIPEFMRFRFRHGGTSVSNTFSATVFVHGPRHGRSR